MKAIHNLFELIEDTLNESPFVETVSRGDIFDIDLDKFTAYPLAHFILNSVIYNGPVLTLEISVLTMGGYNVDNEQYILNEQLAVITKLIERLSRGEAHDTRFHLRGNPLASPFKDRFETSVIGWETTLQIDVPNDMGHE